MSFGAMSAWQAWLLLAGACGIAVWLFLLKVRPPRILVPSLLLWRRVLDDTRELTLWERIRRAVSLVVTALVAVAIALAIVRPSRVTAVSSASRGRLLIVIDSSWSMMTKTSHGETRWERALAEARRLAVAASGDEVVLATTADGLVEGPTSDLALIDAGLDRIEPAGGETSAWPRIAGTQVAHFITDGVVARALSRDVVIDSVFEPAPNVAITAFSVRPSLERERAADSYLEIANFAPVAQKVRLTIVRGQATVLDRSLDIGAGEALRQAVPLPSGADPLIRARVSAPENALPVDDEAFAWITRAQVLNVTVVGQQTSWLRTLLERDPSVRATFVAPAAFQSGTGGAAGTPDVVVFDRWAPEQPPPTPALLFAPPSDTVWLQEGDQIRADEVRPAWRRDAAHPVLLGVDLLTLTVEKTHGYSSSTLRPVAQSEKGTPLVSVDQAPGRRVVVVGFAPSESNLGSAPGFPVLVGNALEWLARPEFLGSHKPGEIMLDGSIARLTGPDNKPVPLERVNDAAIAVLRAPGVYVADGAGARTRIAVNVGDPYVSNVQRTTLPPSAARAVTAGASSRAWWSYFALLAFTLVLFEWFTWQRRITV
jgi:hypothetical protein